ncbi:hypothetical protein C3942_21670 [Solimonas fluminis]|uniref:Pectate lyase superfamily protein domain-containing protein n=1 Tax=Solimonas fluminis TaxID=2086571 RepID=A0A2S5TAE0_9GAMM|nr:right-handed parallel beta-helix repeat-containing protein [Solimonas fluminis]PPE71807.1 hypothetical protein C3942_21670 [Solimonas fluminis]
MSIGIIKSPRRLVNQLRANLADVASGFGSSMVGFKLDAVSAASRTIYEKLAEQVSVKDFGATGDGVTDDTAAIQAAVDFVHFTLGGGTVYFPNGVYIVSDSIQVYSSMTLLGAGADYYTAGVEPLSGCVMKVAANGIMAGLPVFDVSGCRYTTVKGFTFLVAGNDCTGNTTIAIADSAAGPASFLSIEHNRSRYFGGPFVKLFGNVNSIMWNRSNEHHDHIVHMDDSADNFIAFNDFGSHPDNLVAGTLDACLFLDGGANNTIIGNHLYNHGFGIRLTNYSNHNRIEGNRCEKHSHAGIQLDNADRNTLLGNHLFNNGYVSGRQGIDVKNASGGNAIVGNYIFNFAAFPGGTNQLRGIQISGASNNNKVSGNYLIDHEENSIVVDDSTLNLIDGNYIANGKARGISVGNAAHDATVSGNYVYACGQGADNTHDGIFVDASDRVTVRGNTVRHGGGAAQHRWGIRINSGATASVWNNDVTTAGRSGNIADAGGSTEIRANRGFATDNKGTATIGAASTSVNVTHSLGRTPNIADISVTPTNQPTSAAKFWISGVTATQFTINCDAAPGGTGWSFGWRAEVIR